MVLDKVKFLDLSRINSFHQPELLRAFEEALDCGVYVLGDNVELFEEEWARYCGAGYSVSVGSGLDALALSLEALDVGTNDEVIVPAFTFIATWLAVRKVGAIPVPVDCDEKNFNLDIMKLKSAISKRTKAIIPVPLFGCPDNIDAAVKLAYDNNIKIIIDAAQAHGLRACDLGPEANAACFSFYPAKNLGALGDGGAVVSNDPEFIERIKVLRNYGSREKYVHEFIGYNSRMDEMQAAFLRVKLRKLDELNSNRCRIASNYRNNISNRSVVLPTYSDPGKSTWHQFVVKSSARDELARSLAAEGIETVIHYPYPPHKQNAFKGFVTGDLRRAEQLSKTVLSLPIDPLLTEDQVGMVIRAVNAFMP